MNARKYVSIYDLQNAIDQARHGESEDQTQRKKKKIFMNTLFNR